MSEDALVLLESVVDVGALYRTSDCETVMVVIGALLLLSTWCNQNTSARKIFQRCEALDLYVSSPRHTIHMPTSSVGMFRVRLTNQRLLDSALEHGGREIRVDRPTSLLNSAIQPTGSKNSVCSCPSRPNHLTGSLYFAFPRRACDIDSETVLSSRPYRRSPPALRSAGTFCERL